MPTINDLRQQAATIKNATQVGENTATRVGTTFETIADLLEGASVGQGVPPVDLSQLNTLRTPADQTTANPTIYNVTTLHNLSSTTIKVGTLFIFSDGGRAVVTQILLSNYQVDGGGNISSPNTSQITMYYRMFNIVQETWSAWTLYAGGGGGGTIDPYPVSGSDNAVASNGVFEGLQKAAPEVNINDLDDLGDFVDMRTGESSVYTLKYMHTQSSTWLRVGVVMCFANQTQNTLTQIVFSNCVVDGGGNLIPNSATNVMNIYYRFKQFSGNPPEGMTIGEWGAWTKFGDSDYQPDNEDIDLNASDQLQFANKSYDASAFSGLGRVYLRKNIVTLEGTGKNVLTQAMVNTANTIYHIQYDYDLNGETITIPEGCTLEFDGGSVINGVLYGTNTRICAENNAIFNNIKITGNWLVPDIYSEWFADIHEENKLNELISLCNNNIKNTVYIKETEAPYMVAVESDSGAGLVVDKANTDIVLSGIIEMVPNKFQHQYCVLISESNITINGGGKIIGDKDEHDYTTIAGTHEWGYGVNITGRKTAWSDAEIIYNISIRDIEITNCAGDCIFFSWAQKINISNVYLHDARRQGISGTNYAGEIRITNFKITNIYGTAPGCGIALELDNSKSYYGRNYVIENGYIADCYLGIYVSKNNAYTESTSDNTIINNIIFSNDDEEYEDCFHNGCLLFSNTKNINVQNVVCTKENVQFFECRSAEDIIVSNAIGGHLKITLVSGSITFNNCSFSSNAKELIYDNSLIYGGSKQNLSIVFNNCNLASSVYAFCSSTNLTNKTIQFNNCKVAAETLARMTKNVLYFYGCNISCTKEMQTGEFHNCTIKVVTENDVPLRYISSYNSIFEITMNCPSSGSYPGSVGIPFNFSLENTFFINNRVTITSEIELPLFSLYRIVDNAVTKNIKIIDNVFVVNTSSKTFKSNNMYYIPTSLSSKKIIISNAGLHNKSGNTQDRPELLFKIQDGTDTYIDNAVIGFAFFDTSLTPAIPIYWTGTGWVDATGVAV